MLCENSKYSRVEELTGASSATIGRVNRCIQFGSGGYRTVLENIGCIDSEGN
jgi:TrpR-related protein YerC/YecD